MLQSDHKDTCVVQHGSNGLVYMLILGEVLGRGRRLVCGIGLKYICWNVMAYR